MNRIFVVGILLFSLNCILAADNVQAVTDSTSLWLNSLPRKTYDGKVTTNTMFVAPAVDYFNALGPFGVFPLAIGAGGALLAIILFTVFRFGCDRCGGKEPNEDGYTFAEKNIVVGLLIGFSIIQLGCIAGIVVGHFFFTPSSTNFMADVQIAANNSLVAALKVEPGLLLANVTATNQDPFVGLVEGEARIAGRVASDAQVQATNYESYRVIVLAVTCGIAGVGALFGIIGWIAKQPGVSLFTGYLWLVVVGLAAFNLGVHFAISASLADICNDVNNYPLSQRFADRTADQGKIYNSAALNSVVFCGNFSIFANTELLVNKLLEQTNDTAQIDSLNSIKSDVTLLRDCQWATRAYDSFSIAKGGEGCTKSMTGLIIIWALSFIMALFAIGLSVLNIIGYKRFRSFVGDGFF